MLINFLPTKAEYISIYDHAISNVEPSFSTQSTRLIGSSVNRVMDSGRS